MGALNFGIQLEREKRGRATAERAIRRLWDGVEGIVWFSGVAAQKSGHDVGVTLSSGEYFTVDLKFRPTRRYTGDILLELFSEDENGKRRGQGGRLETKLAKRSSTSGTTTKA